MKLFKESNEDMRTSSHQLSAEMNKLVNAVKEVTEAIEGKLHETHYHGPSQ